MLVSTNARQALIEAYREKYNFNSDDKVAQPCSLYWDVSIGNFVIAFTNGASLYIPTELELLNPARFIRKHHITVWHSVPTIASMLKERGTLKDDVFPSLRWTDFIGEALNYEIASAWKRAAPHSRVINSYGPTEATVECLDFEIHDFVHKGNVPIGYVYPQCHAMICNSELEKLPDGEVGELLISGPQLAEGYIGDPEKTAQAFPVIDGVRWYRTGDSASRDSHGCFYFHGRLDHQVKVLGHRVELEGIEAIIKHESGVSVVVCGWPIGKPHKTMLIAFVKCPADKLATLKAQIAPSLPAYALPKHLFSIEEIPLTHNGKTNRKKLEQVAQELLSKEGL